MIAQFLTLKQNTSTKNWSSVDFPTKISKTSTGKIAAGRHNRAHSNHYRKSISVKIKKNATISRILQVVDTSRPLATRTCETTKIPAGLQKRDLWTFRYASERKNQKMTKTIKGNDIFFKLMFYVEEVIPEPPCRYISLHIDALTSPKCKTHLKNRKFSTFFQNQLQTDMENFVFLRHANE